MGSGERKRSLQSARLISPWGLLQPLAQGHARPRDVGAANQEEQRAVALRRGTVSLRYSPHEERLLHFHFTPCFL